jgi:molybdenum cofactor biosynthesis enzyme
MAARKSGLTHLDAANRPTMVDVGAKPVTREASAEARLKLPADVARALKRSGHRTKARCSTPRSSPASSQPSARMN